MSDNPQIEVKPGPPRPNETPSLAIGHYLAGLLGATLGAVAGYLVFIGVGRLGLYGISIIGLLIGFGCGILSRGRSRALGLLCAVGALLVGILAEWRYFPFLADESLSYFLAHLHQVLPSHLILIGLGVGCAYWLGTGRRDR